MSLYAILKRSFPAARSLGALVPSASGTALLRMHDSDLFTGLDNFLAAGALALSITRTGVLDGNHKQADDGWALLPSQVVTAPESGIPDADAETFDSLLFLVRHRFIAATYLVHSSASLLFVRVYLIPWDLPGSKGVLRLRDDDAVLRPGRKRLRALFLRIRQDRSLWEGDGASSSTPHHFWESVVVSSRAACVQDRDLTMTWSCRTTGVFWKSTMTYHRRSPTLSLSTSQSSIARCTAISVEPCRRWWRGRRTAGPSRTRCTSRLEESMGRPSTYYPRPWSWCQSAHAYHRYLEEFSAKSWGRARPS